jgi:ribosomal protein L31
MAEPPLGYGPQGLALEVNPWQTKKSVEDALLYRGAIVSAWANVETTLIEIAIRASCHPAYAGVRDTYPWKLNGRISYLRLILGQPGPLHEFRSVGESVLKRFVESAELRNMMAHGRMAMLAGWGPSLSVFRPASGHEIKYYTRRFFEGELERLARKATRFSRAVRYLHAQLNAREFLPPLDDAG